MKITFDGRLSFTLVLLAFALLILVLTLMLGPTARLVPLRIAMPTVGLLVFQALRDVRREATADATETQARPDDTSELAVLLWVLALPALVYLGGLVIAAPIYAFVYLRWRSRLSNVRAAGVAIVAWGLAYGVFELLMVAGAYEGRVWVWLGL
jgi:hypothetical protein